MGLPATVEAITIPHTGGIDVMEKTSIPFPHPKPNEFLVKVDYAGVNFIDTYYRSGLYPYKSFPAVIGWETAGTILALPTDPNILNHDAFKKQGFKLGGKLASEWLGTHATYIAVPWDHAYSVPDSVSTKIAAAALLQGVTALSFTEEAYKLQKGDTILVHTVAGGLGLLLTQFIKRAGATVIGTTSTPEKAALAKSYGADYVILYRSENTVERVLEITNGRGVDAIYDGVGKDTFDANFEMIKRKGTIVSLGNASGAVAPFSLFKLIPKNVKLLRPTMAGYVATPEEVAHYGRELYSLVESGELKFSIYQEYPFTAAGVQEAQRDLTGGRTTGKVIVKVNSDA